MYSMRPSFSPRYCSRLCLSHCCMCVMKRGNIAPRAGFEPKSLAFRTSVLTISPLRLPDVYNVDWSWFGLFVFVYNVTTSKVISGRVSTCDNGTLMSLHSAAPLGHQAAGYPHSVTLSKYWANQSLPYPNNSDRLARKKETSVNFKVIGLTRPDQHSNQQGPNLPDLQNTGDGRSTHLVILSGPMWIET